MIQVHDGQVPPQLILDHLIERGAGPATCSHLYSAQYAANVAFWHYSKPLRVITQIPQCHDAICPDGQIEYVTLSDSGILSISAFYDQLGINWEHEEGYVQRT